MINENKIADDTFYKEVSSAIIIYFRGVLILTPSLDVDIIDAQCAERIDERRSQTAVGNQWYVEVDGCTTNLITIRKLTNCEILRNIYNHINLVLTKHIKSLWLLSLLFSAMGCPKSLVRVSGRWHPIAS